MLDLLKIDGTARRLSEKNSTLNDRVEDILRLEDRLLVLVRTYYTVFSLKHKYLENSEYTRSHIHCLLNT